MRRNRWVVAAVACALASCGEPGAPQAPSPTAPPTGAADPHEPGAQPGAWRELHEETFTEAEMALRARGNKAREALFGRLMARLTEVISSSGVAGAVTVCRAEAPGIAEAVGKEHRLRIGRTSHRLRNASNAAPGWAKPYVEERTSEPVFLTDGAAHLAMLQPIRLKPLCLPCHGDPATMDPAVREAIAKAYPGDQATGFADGDLRGWFWIEVR